MRGTNERVCVVHMQAGPAGSFRMKSDEPPTWAVLPQSFLGFSFAVYKCYLFIYFLLEQL